MQQAPAFRRGTSVSPASGKPIQTTEDVSKVGHPKKDLAKMGEKSREHRALSRAAAPAMCESAQLRTTPCREHWIPTHVKVR